MRNKFVAVGGGHYVPSTARVRSRRSASDDQADPSELKHMDSGIVCDLVSPALIASPFILFQPLRQQDSILTMWLINAFLPAVYEEAHTVPLELKRFSKEEARSDYAPRG